MVQILPLLTLPGDKLNASFIMEHATNSLPDDIDPGLIERLNNIVVQLTQHRIFKKKHSISLGKL